MKHRFSFNKYISSLTLRIARISGNVDVDEDKLISTINKNGKYLYFYANQTGYNFGLTNVINKGISNKKPNLKSAILVKPFGKMKSEDGTLYYTIASNNCFSEVVKALPNFLYLDFNNRKLIFTPRDKSLDNLAIKLSDINSKDENIAKLGIIADFLTNISQHNQPYSIDYKDGNFLINIQNKEGEYTGFFISENGDNVKKIHSNFKIRFEASEKENYYQESK